jgi:hypothetical protein
MTKLTATHHRFNRSQNCNDFTGSTMKVECFKMGSIKAGMRGLGGIFMRLAIYIIFTVNTVNTLIELIRLTPMTS